MFNKYFLALLFFSLLHAGPAFAQSRAQSAKADSGMVLIPQGEFWMGSDSPTDLPNERPRYRVRLSPFWMDRYTVTNADFEQFVRASNYQTVAERPIEWEELRAQLPSGTERPSSELLQPGSLVFTPPLHRVPFDDLSQWWSWKTGAQWREPQGRGSTLKGRDRHPVVHVAWDDARAYCAWRGKRLPTEAEWEYAARGGHDGERFPWGNTFRPNGVYHANTFTGAFPHRNTAEDGYDRTAPVGSFPPNAYGLYDMAGNVWQWTADVYREDSHAVALRTVHEKALHCLENPRAPLVEGASFERVTKGGSFLCHASYCEGYRPAARRGTPADTASEHIGFRCAMDVVR